MSNHHLSGFTKEHAGELTILVGDPARVHLFSELLTDSTVVVNNREFIAVSGLFNKQRISIISTGIGVGSTEIAVIELIASGAKRLVRVGGCGAWQDQVNPGDIIMNHAMARGTGMLSAYVPDNYPAVADPLLFNQIYQYLSKHNKCIHTGIGLTAEGFYLSQGRDLNLFGQSHAEQVMSYWQQRKILNAEMETAVIYLLGALYQIPVANCLVAHVSRKNNQWVGNLDYQSTHLNTAQLVIESIIPTQL
ncbi:nucleoside phosphorylase [Orbus mooreae]|uniref:nucleoside phosphorylase n=1 Tax=Orbus mooreae TaxID=3074107 RepID=UPI00370D7AFC